MFKWLFHILIFVTNIVANIEIKKSHSILRENSDYLYPSINRVPTSFGNHGKPGKSPKKVPCMEKSWNLKKP